MNIPPRDGTLPLWPLALIAGLLPAVAALVAWALALHAGLAPACNPFFDGCVSISRVARHGLPNHVFRALVLPAATLQALVWLLQAQALHAAGGSALRRSALLLALVGVGAGICLVLYGSFLGTEGAAYRWLRRYGTVGYFGGTCVALLLLARALQRMRASQALLLPRTHERAWPLQSAHTGAPTARRLPEERLLLVLLGLIVALGLGNALAGAWAGSDALKDRVENVTEWWGALGLTLGFVTLASLWRRWDLRLRITREA